MTTSVQTASTVDFNKISAFEAGKAAGTQFLLKHIQPDGSVEGAGLPRVTYYRFPWALAVAGETGASYRVLDWIERYGMCEDGQFHGGVAWDPEANRTVNTYAETILAYGAVLLRRLDIARRAMSFAHQYQDDVTGGIYMAREETGPDGFQLLFPTAQYGMSALISRNDDAAVRAGHWFERLWEAQPELPDRLYTVWSRTSGLVTDVPASENVNHFINDATRERQFHYNGGIAAAFLTQLFMATQEERWLKLARRFQQFSMDSTDDQFHTRQVCKSAWGAGLLYLATHDPVYLPWIERMGRWFVDCQDPDGGWSNTPYLDPNPSLAHRLETTAEFIVHLDTVIAALSAASSRNSGTRQA